LSSPPVGGLYKNKYNTNNFRVRNIMKFAIAAGILAQTLPVVSEKAESSKILRQDANHEVYSGQVVYVGDVNQTQPNLENRNKIHPPSRTGGLLKNTPLAEIKMCDPLSDDPDIGILSCDIGCHCDADENMPLGGKCASGFPTTKIELPGGILKNALHTDNLVVEEISRECDPSADVGVLGCSENQECVFVHASSLGGLCTSTIRELQSNDDDGPISRCFLCAPGEYVPEAHYAFDIVVTEYENLTCADLAYAAYFDYTDYITIDTGDTCLSVVEAAQTSGCCAPDLKDFQFCDICGPGLYISEDNYDIALRIPIDGYEGTTCEDLAVTASYNQTVYAFCPTFAQVARMSGCCAVYIPPLTSCRICGEGGTLIEDTLISIQGYNRTCTEAQEDDAFCEAFAPMFSDACCTSGQDFPTTATPAPTTAHSDIPTMAPQASLPLAPQGATSSSVSNAATKIRSMNTCVSVTGLVAATAVALVMN
jgi:hypothetical protein